MRTAQLIGDWDGYMTVSGSGADVLSVAAERKLLKEICACREKLNTALARIPNYGDDEQDSPKTLGQYIAAINAGNAITEARLGAVFRRYTELRSKLALANMRLVAHVVKRFRGRGVAYGDLLQDGFCGLLEAIDRFDPSFETKLATYATWWIRQAVQRSVAEGAYPVRLSPRHLRQLAQCQDELTHSGPSDDPTDLSDHYHESIASETVQRIHAATRPTLSLDATLASDSEFNLLQVMRDREPDPIDLVDSGESVAKLLNELRPREQQVLELRFGLGDKPKLSLSEVGKVLEVSKERVRQIQDRALEKLREIAEGTQLAETFDPNSE